MKLRSHKSTIKQRLRGYQAANKHIEKMLDIAQKDRPRSRVKFNSNSFRAGYFHGLVLAHSMMILGQFPNIPENKEIIERAL